MGTDGPKTRFDHQLLANFAKEAEENDPIDWNETEIDRDLAYLVMASQIAEMFQDYSVRDVDLQTQMAIAMGTIVKLSVENFVLHERMVRAGLGQSVAGIDIDRLRRDPRQPD